MIEGFWMTVGFILAKLALVGVVLAILVLIFVVGMLFHIFSGGAK